MLIAEHISRIIINAGYACNSVTNVKAALEQISTQKPIIVLTNNMLMGDQTGIDLGKIIHENYHLPSVYITSYSGNEIISQVRTTHPNAYLVKPFKKEDLLIAIELALYNSSTKERTSSKALIINDGRVTAQIPYEEIIWLEAEGNYTLIVTESMKKGMIRSTISELIQQLPENDFIRIHRSFVVNRTKITELAAAHVLINGEKLPLGRTFKEEVTEKYMQ